MQTFYIGTILADAKKYKNNPCDIARELAEIFGQVQFVRNWGEPGKMILSLAEFIGEYK